MPLIVSRGWVMGKDCGRGNERLGAGHWLYITLPKGRREGRKFLQTCRLAYLFRNAPNLGKRAIFKYLNIYYLFIIYFPYLKVRKHPTWQFNILITNELSTRGLHNPRTWELRGIIMNENSRQKVDSKNNKIIQLWWTEGTALASIVHQWTYELFWMFKWLKVQQEKKQNYSPLRSSTFYQTLILGTILVRLLVAVLSLWISVASPIKIFLEYVGHEFLLFADGRGHWGLRCCLVFCAVFPVFRWIKSHIALLRWCQTLRCAIFGAFKPTVLGETKLFAVLRHQQCQYILHADHALWLVYMTYVMCLQGCP